MLHRAGKAQANLWSSDPYMSKGGCATVKDCARQAPGHQKIASILRLSCGPGSSDYSCKRLNPHPQCSSCQNSLWVVSRSRRSVKIGWNACEAKSKLSLRVKAHSLNVLKVTGRTCRSISDFW